MPQMSLYSQVKTGRIEVHHKSPPELRFWKAVEKNGPTHLVLQTKCWEWTGGKSGGYGMIYVAGTHLRSHVYSYQLHRGPTAPGVKVLYRCDNPGCVNPDHLFIGSQLDNIADMVRKGSQSGAVGERERERERETRKLN